ncbi:hypothetical protein ES708_32190 [subsurface metagenome]
MNVQDLLEKQFGVKSTYNENPETATILASPAKTKFLSYNPRRISFVVINLSAVTVLVAPDVDVAIAPNKRGIYLVPNGGTLSMVWTEDFEMPTMEWYAMANGANAEIFVLEVLTL